MTLYGPRPRNARKLEILNTLASISSPGWISAPVLRVRLKFSISRVALYRRLDAYARWQLVERTQGIVHLLFRITPKGRARLAWLTARARRTPAP